MAYLLYDFERIASTGQPAADGASVATSDFSPPAMLRLVSSGGALAYSAAHKTDGLLGLRILTSTAGSVVLRLAPPAVSMVMSMRLALTLPERPASGGYYLVSARNTSDAMILGLYYASDGRLALYGAASSLLSILCAAGTTTPGEVVDFAARFAVGATTTSGSASAAIYPHGSTEARGTVYNGSGRNLGTAACDRINLGVTATTSPLTIGVDSVQIESDRTTEIPALGGVAASRGLILRDGQTVQLGTPVVVP